MKHSNFSRILSFVLALVMVLSMAPVSVFASDSAVYSQITSLDELTTGKYVLVDDKGHAPTVLDGSWILTEAVTADGSITAPAANLVWDITVNADAVKLTDSNGVTVAPKGGNENGIKAADYEWKVEFTDGTFRFLGQGADTVVLAGNTGSGNKYRAYKTATVSKTPGGYPSYFTLYKLDEGSSTAPTDPVDPKPSEPVVTEPKPSEPVVSAAPIAAGDRVVIYAPAYGKALSTVKTGNYNVGVDVALTDGVLTGYGETEVFTVIDNGDGSFSFAYEGQNLGMADSYASMNLGAVHDDWTLVDLGSGLYNIKNTGRGNFIEWYSQYSNWSTYNSSSAATDGQFQLSFEIVTGDIPVAPDPEPEPEPDPVVETATYMAEAPQDGDTILIYNATNTAVMGSALNGKKVAGVTAAAENDAITLSDDMARLLVTVDGEHYIFSLDGKYLTSAETGNGMSYAEELTDCAKWTLEQKDDGKFILMNVGANYNGTYNQAMEYYNGFTTYGVKETDIYKMDFYLVEAAKQSGIVTELHEGDTIVIFNPANMKAMSTAYTGFYNLGTDVTLADGKLSGYTEADIWTVGINADGTYTHAITGDQPNYRDERFSSFNTYCAMDFDGERLILVDILTESRYHALQTCNLCLAIYDGTGLCYYGEYQNGLSVNPDTSRYDYNIIPLDLSVEWS